MIESISYHSLGVDCVGGDSGSDCDSGKPGGLRRARSLGVMRWRHDFGGETTPAAISREVGLVNVARGRCSSSRDRTTRLSDVTDDAIFRRECE